MIFYLLLSVFCLLVLFLGLWVSAFPQYVGFS